MRNGPQLGSVLISRRSGQTFSPAQLMTAALLLRFYQQFAEKISGSSEICVSKSAFSANTSDLQKENHP